MRNEQYLERPLPSNNEAEEVCIASVILDNEKMTEVKAQLGPEDFYSPFNKRVFAAMIELHESGSSIDPILIGNIMRKEGSLDSMGGVSRITDLTMGLPHFQNIDEYITMVKTLSASRQALRILVATERDLLAEDVDPAEVLAKVEHKILQLNNRLNADHGKMQDGFVSVKDIVPEVREQFERYHAGISTGVKTGMEELDNVLDGGGLQKKAVYLVGGTEKSGKTSLLLDWASHAVIEQGFCIPIVTLEMSKETLTKRLYSAYTGIPYYMFRPGFYDSPYDNPYTRAIEGLEKFKEFDFKIADNLFTWEQIRRYCGRVIENGLKEGQNPVGFIILDYLQLINLDRHTSNQTQTVTEVSRNIKIMSSEFDVPIVTISNLNRVGMADGAEPDTYNLRDSGSLAYDAEAILFVHNPAYVPGKPFVSEEVSDRVLILSRQRNGPTARIKLKYIGPYMSFMTESQYATHFGDGELKSKGQKRESTRALEDLWDEDDDDW